MRRTAILLLILGLASSSCGGEESAGGLCNPASTRACLCDGLTLGEQTCEQEGMGWSRCSCGDPCAGGACEVDSSTCDPGGLCVSCKVDEDCGSDRCLAGRCFAETLPTWNLEIGEADLASLDAEPQIEVPCRLVVDGVEYPDCEVRYRGATSLEYPKKSFRLKFPEGGEHPGYSRKINLRAEYNDPSLLRNHLALETFRRLTSIPAPRSRFLVLNLNGDDYGVFLEVERIGGKFLEKRGRDREMTMFEADSSGEVFTQGATTMIPLEGDLWDKAYDLKTGDETRAREELSTFIGRDIWYDYLDGVDEPDHRTRRIRSVLDVDGFLDYLAIMALLQNHEHIKKNYYFTLQDLGSGPLWEFYPWDLDLTFGCSYTGVGLGTLCEGISWDEDPVRGTLPGGVTDGYPEIRFVNLLINQILTDPELRELFEVRVCRMIDSGWWSGEGAGYVSEVAALITPALLEDTRDRSSTPEELELAFEELASFFALRADFLRDYLDCASR